MPRLVLAGLGHSHLFVLEAAIQGKLPPCELVVCTGEPEHVYSGMVPGWLGGRYGPEEVALAVAPLVRAAGGIWRQAHVSGLNPSTRTIALADGTSERFDICSVAVGSVPAGIDLPGVREHAIPLKPLANLHRILAELERLARRGGGDVVVVGGGMAGVEIAFGAMARLRQLGAADTVRVIIIHRDAALAEGRGRRVARMVDRARQRLGIAVHTNTSIRAVEPEGVRAMSTAGEMLIPADLVIWAAGPAAPPWLADTGLPCDARGFLLVDDRLRTIGHPSVLAAGDAATLNTHRQTDKAGVYAVRMGPRLVETMRHILGAGPLPPPYIPQRRWLALLNTGDDSAIASWGPFALEGRWAMRWKDQIDRTFMARFDEDVGRRS